MLHMFLTAPVWSEEALARAKALFRSNRGALAKSLEKETTERVMQARVCAVSSVFVWHLCAMGVGGG
jgi:hypothetical protein